MSDLRRRRREWPLLAVLSIGAPVLVFGALEVLLRLTSFGYPPGFWVPVEGRALLATNDKFGWRFFPPLLARTPAPEVIELKKPPNTRRVFVLGESAALGFPEPAFGVARMLEIILRNRHPGIQLQVRTAAMTAINSHALVSIARDCARFEPDVFIVFMGNNEAVGPYGPATIFGRADLSVSLVRLSIWQSSTRIGQAMAQVTRDRSQSQQEWRGMEMFVNHRVPASDPRLDRMYRNFQVNLRDIAEMGLNAGAAVMLVTVPVNLRDCPPFASVHRAGMTAAEREQWKVTFEKGRNAEAQGDLSRALSLYRAALAYDSQHAELHFRLARALFASGDASAAAEHYIRARDFDALRFRADSRINEVVRDVAGSLRSRGVRLVDAEADFGLAGEELFFEHVHLTPEGNHRLASAIAQQLEPGRIPPFDEVRRAMALTRWDESRMRLQMAALMERPPFTDQLDHNRRLQRFKSTIERGPLPSEARPVYEIALRSRPADIHLLARYAELLRASGDPAGAAGQWAKLIEQVPGRKAWHASRGAALSDAGRQDEAVAEYGSALAIDPGFDIAHFGLGVARALQDRFADAARHYEAALRINPTYAEAAYNLAGVLTRMGRSQEAEAALKRAIHIRPAFAEAHAALARLLARGNNIKGAIERYRTALKANLEMAEAQYDLGVLLVRVGRIDEGIACYREAIRLRPKYAEAYNNLGTALARKGDYQSAARFFARAVELRPPFEAAQVNLERARALLRKSKTTTP